jgi:hypothetical protein
MLSLVNTKTDPFLANKAIILLNNILCRATEQNQLRMLTLLKEGDKFFHVFFYLKERLNASKKYLITNVKQGARSKFISDNINDKSTKKEVKPNDFKSQKIYVSAKYDVEQKYQDLKDSWMEDEMIHLLQFLNSLCENCFKPAQLFLRNQIFDDESKAQNHKNGKITSIDLIYHVVCLFIDLIDTLGDFVFSDYRTFKLIPMIMDTLIEFIYGPCIQN